MLFYSAIFELKQNKKYKNVDIGMIFNLYTLFGVCIMYIYDIPIRRLMFSYINSIVYFTMLNKYRFRLYNFFFALLFL